MNTKRICASSGTIIPDGGFVVCVCGRVWQNISAIPIHDTETNRIPKTHKARIQISQELNTWYSRQQTKRAFDKRNQVKEKDND